MPSFERPSLAEIIRRKTSDFEHEQGVQAARLPGTPENAFVRSGAGVAHGLHGRIDRTRRDAFLATCSDEAAIQKARLFGIFQIPATMSTGIILVDAEPATIIPKDTIFVRGDGALYITTASAEAVEGTALCPGRAMASGPDGNMSPGTKLALQTPIVNVVDQATADTGGWTNGFAAETTASIRQRLAKRLADPPKGGGPGDYVRWALGDADEDKIPEGATPPAGVTRAWEYGKVPKIGRVTVLIMRDGDDDPFPTLEQRKEVWQWIKLFAPIALPFPFVDDDPTQQSVLTPNPKPLPVEIHLTLEPGADEATVKAAITQSLKDMIAERASPPPDGAQLFYKSWINEAISRVPGELDHKVIEPVGDVSLAKWDLVFLDSVTWS